MGGVQVEKLYRNTFWKNGDVYALIMFGAMETNNNGFICLYPLSFGPLERVHLNRQVISSMCKSAPVV